MKKKMPLNPIIFITCVTNGWFIGNNLINPIITDALIIT